MRLFGLNETVRERGCDRNMPQLSLRHPIGTNGNGERIKKNSDRVANAAPSRAPFEFTFHTDKLEVTISNLSHERMTRLGLTLSLQTFLTALTWICSSNKAPLAGWLRVAVCKRSILCRVEVNPCDSSSPHLVPVSRKIPSILRAAIQSFSRHGHA